MLCVLNFTYPALRDDTLRQIGCQTLDISNPASAACLSNRLVFPSAPADDCVDHEMAGA